MNRDRHGISWTMGYLDTERLAAADGAAFQARRPFPWAAFDGLLSPAAWQELRQALPPFSQFTPVFGRKRAHGQRSHDRYVLQHKPWTRLPDPWRDFVRELKGPAYRDFLARLLGHDDFLLHFHWHYTPAGCEVSPHCDATWKLGSHIFYFNDESDWDPAWGGATLILDDGGRFPADSAPDFSEFDDTQVGPVVGNRSLLFRRQAHSWHGVQAIACPEDHYRKVFIVEIRHATPVQRARVALGF